MFSKLSIFPYLCVKKWIVLPLRLHHLKTSLLWLLSLVELSWPASLSLISLFHFSSLTKLRQHHLDREKTHHHGRQLLLPFCSLHSFIYSSFYSFSSSWQAPLVLFALHLLVLHFIHSHFIREADHHLTFEFYLLLICRVFIAPFNLVTLLRSPFLSLYFTRSFLWRLPLALTFTSPVDTPPATQSTYPSVFWWIPRSALLHLCLLQLPFRACCHGFGSRRGNSLESELWLIATKSSRCTCWHESCAMDLNHTLRALTHTQTKYACRVRPIHCLECCWWVFAAPSEPHKAFQEDAVSCITLVCH